jgi:hypothetical protein
MSRTDIEIIAMIGIPSGPIVTRCLCFGNVWHEVSPIDLPSLLVPLRPSPKTPEKVLVEYGLRAAIDFAKVLPEMAVSFRCDDTSLKQLCRPAPMVDVVTVDADNFNAQEDSRSDRLFLPVVPHFMAVQLPVGRAADGAE